MMNHIRPLRQPVDMLDIAHGKRCLCGHLLRSPQEKEQQLCMECRMTRSPESLLRLQNVLCHLKVLNRQELSEREQEAIVDVIASAGDRVTYFLQQTER